MTINIAVLAQIWSILTPEYNFIQRISLAVYDNYNDKINITIRIHNVVWHDKFIYITFSFIHSKNLMTDSSTPDDRIYILFSLLRNAAWN